jgi:flap endonuclease-1
MGIKNINETVTKESPRAFFVIPLEMAKRKRILIDAPIWVYANVGIIQRNIVRRMKDPLEEIDRGEVMTQCLNAMLRFHTRFLDLDITPVWLKDGKAPKEKAETRQKRQKGRADTKTKIETLKNKLNNQDPLLHNKKELDELRALLSNYNHIYPEEFTLIYNILEGFGIPIIKCPSEAEAYGCAINVKGLAFGIWTVDTDCYALGGINMITGMSGKDAEGHPLIDIVHIPYILDDLGFNKKEMRDFCIMCGTDFNDNIPNIGAGRALTHIQKYKSITKFKKYEKKKDASILNYKRSRQLLTPPECDLTHESPELYHNSEAFHTHARELCTQYNLGESYAKMMYHIDRDIPVEIYNGRCPKIGKKKIVVVKKQTEIEEEEEKESKVTACNKPSKKKKKIKTKQESSIEEEVKPKSKKKQESSSEEWGKIDTVKIKISNITPLQKTSLKKKKKEVIELD